MRSAYTASANISARFRTLFELERELRKRGRRYLSTSISARLRELRRAEYGAYIVDKRLKRPSDSRAWEYRVIAPEPQRQLFEEVA